MSYWRALRRRVLTPDISATKLEVRGFHEKDPDAKALLETVGGTFLTGYAYAAEAANAAEAEESLELIERRFRGFGYEGAAMAMAMLDGLPIGGRGHVAEFLAGRAADHVYMAYIGVGWAMARLPRFRWWTLHAPDELLRWLVLDGYGFHQAYFHTDKYVYQQFQEERFPWPTDDATGYASRVIDQGIGRAMWFVGGADPSVVTKMLGEFAPERRSDLYSGAGLAATYAGGVSRSELEAFWTDAGQYRRNLAQGSAFAAGARVQAGLVVPYTEMATEVFLGMTPPQAHDINAISLPDGPGEGGVPSYEMWRQRITEEFVSLGRR